jgi:two-component system KDP operon response regulator KdpE
MENRTMTLKLMNERFLLITARAFDWTSSLQQAAVKLVETRSESDFMSALNSNYYDIVMMDQACLEGDAIELLQHVHNRFPSLTILFITDSDNVASHDAFVEAGADEVLMSDLSLDKFVHRLNLVMAQYQRNRLLAQRTKHLHAISMLAQDLYNAEHPKSLIVDTIDSLCNAFGIYAVAITIDSGDAPHLYAGIRGQKHRRRPYESTIAMQVYDPLYYVIISGVSMIFRDITLHPNFQPIPVVENPKAAMIVPIKYGEQTLGSMALFSDNEPFNNGDLASYELLATHVASAYSNVSHYYTQEEDFRAQRHLLKAWQALTTNFAIEEIAQTLHDFIVEIETVYQVVVWLFHTRDEQQEIVPYSTTPGWANLVYSLHSKGALDELVEEFDARMQPIALNHRRIRNEAIREIFQTIETPQVMMLPIAGNMFVGGVFITSSGNLSFSPQDISLMENLTHATAQAMERNTLISAMQEQTGRLESLLRSVREAIFFVSESGKVIFCNPQFTELTNISPAQVINVHYQALFRQLAHNAINYDDVLDQLDQALKDIQASDPELENYPIVEIRQPQLESDIYIEFMNVATDDKQGSWMGIIRDRKLGGMMDSHSGRSDFIGDMIQDVGIPLLELHNTTMLLPKQYDVLGPRQYIQLLSRLEHQARDVQTLWNNFMQIYQTETHGMVLNKHLSDPTEFLEDLFAERWVNAYRRQLSLSTRPPRARIEVDERFMRQTIMNIIDFVAYYSPPSAPILVQVATEQNMSVISIQEKTTLLPEHVLEYLLDPTRASDPANTELPPHRLGIYLTRRIIEAHDGQLDITSRRGWGLMVKIQIPVAEIDVTNVEQVVGDSINQSSRSGGLSALIVESPTRLLGSMYNILDFEGHELFVVQAIEEAISDLRLTQIDLIMLEADSSQIDLTYATETLRQQTDVPIMLVASPDMEDACLRAMKKGADDYLLTPLSRERLLPKMQAIAKRKEIATRTAEPIQIGELHIDFSRRRVYLSDKRLDLTAKEYELLRVLAMNKDQVVTRQQLLTKIWGPEYRDETQYLWVNISRLRRKLEPGKNAPRYIHTEQGVGYALREP